MGRQETQVSEARRGASGLFAGVPDVESFGMCSIEESLVGGDEAHVRGGEEIARDNSAAELDCVQGPQIVAIDQRVCGFEDRRIDRLLDDSSQFIRERIKSQCGFGRGHAVSLAKSTDGGSGFSLRQCGDDLVAVVSRLDKSQHIVAALLCDEELQ